MSTASHRLGDQGHRRPQDMEFYSPVPDPYRKGFHKYVVVVSTSPVCGDNDAVAVAIGSVLRESSLRVTPLRLMQSYSTRFDARGGQGAGEVFVLEDGTLCPRALGVYERFLDRPLTRASFRSMGQIYADILDRERAGGYLGRDIRAVPHLTGEIKRSIRELAVSTENGRQMDVVLIALDGVAGTRGPAIFLEAIRELAFEEGPESCCVVAVTRATDPGSLGDPSMEAAQLGLRSLIEQGIKPNIVCCGAPGALGEAAMMRTALSAGVGLDRVFVFPDDAAPDRLLEWVRGTALWQRVCSVLSLYHRALDPHASTAAVARDWDPVMSALMAPRDQHATVAVVGGGGAELGDHPSLVSALEHSAARLSCELSFVHVGVPDADNSGALLEMLDGVDAVVVPDGSELDDSGPVLGCIRFCREHGVPCLAIGRGFEDAVLEFAHNATGLGAEHDRAPGAGLEQLAFAAIADAPEGTDGGPRMLGACPVGVHPGTIASSLSRPAPVERFRSAIDLSPACLASVESAGMVVGARHPEHPVVQSVELPYHRHPFYLATRFLPELTSRPRDVHPIFSGLVASAIRHRAGGDADLSPTVRGWLGSGQIARLDVLPPITAEQLLERVRPGGARGGAGASRTVAIELRYCTLLISCAEWARDEPFVAGVPTELALAVVAGPLRRELRGTPAHLLVQLSTLGLELDQNHVSGCEVHDPEELADDDVVRIGAVPTAAGFFDMNIALISDYTSVAEYPHPVHVVSPSGIALGDSSRDLVDIGG